MIENTIGKIEERIRKSQSIGQERQNELLALVGTLKSEINELARTNDDQAKSITGFVDISTHEAIRATQNPELLNLSVEGLRSSVVGFEQTHPVLVRVVNNISHMLSNLGI